MRTDGVKKTLYQVIGVEADASAEAVASAYTTRLAELNATTAYDPNALGLLRQANEILSDPARRSAYDASMRTRDQNPRGTVDGGSKPAAVPVWAGAAFAAVIFVGLGAWWMTRSKPPSAQKLGPPRVVIGIPSHPSTSAHPGQSINTPREEGAESAPAPKSDRPSATSPSDGMSTGVVGTARTAEHVFAELSPSIGKVNVLDGSGRQLGSGSGVVIEKEVVLTNCHVVTQGTTLTVKFADKTLRASVQLADDTYDLCRLSVPGLTAPTVATGSVKSLRTGQRVYAIGAPAGLELTISEGIVSALREVDIGTVIQTTAPISPGSSGGGLFDLSGKLVGIMTFQHRYGQNLNFAVPADWIGNMRVRTASELARRSVAVATQSQSKAPVNLIVGQWFCREPIAGRSGQYTFEPDGGLNIAMTDQRFASLRYRVSGNVLQIADGERTTALMIEEISAPRMVLNTGTEGRRLACERNG